MNSSSVELRIKAFLAKYSPEISAQLAAARAHLRALFPHGHELVYDNYNALVFAFAATDRTSDAFVSIAGYPKWVTLFFLRGIDLHDPKGLLQGSGTQVRSIRLHSAQHLLEPDVLALIDQAIVPHSAAFAKASALQTTIRMVAAKQRPRQPAARAGKRTTAI